MKLTIKEYDEDRHGLLYVVTDGQGTYWSEDLDRFSSRPESYSKDEAERIFKELKGVM